METLETKKNRAIIPAKTAIETFRDSGYKNTASALAELIDNSIEAEADNIRILTFEEPIQGKKRLIQTITKVAVYDDGIGMPPETMSICLQFGNGTRLNSREGIGRFGIGLPNASVSQCRRIEVYSWQNNKCYYTHLDIDEIKEQELHEVNEVIEKEIPEDVIKSLDLEIKESGTIIFWKKCDRLDMSRSKTLYKTLAGDLCRIYRHFLDDDNTYGRQRDITLVSTGIEKSTYKLKSNDPLYLMKPNSVPNYGNEATNILHGEVIKLPIQYDYDGSTSEVEIRFSIALPETQKIGGNSALGKHYKQNTGISFIRAGREIDFNDFGFYNTQEERQRWWGCEIRFEPILDELFGVTNNKQSLRRIKYVSRKELEKEHPECFEELFDTDLKLKLCLELSKIFKNNHSKIWDIILNRAAGTRSNKLETIDKSTKIANKELEKKSVKTESSIEGDTKTEIQKEKEWTEIISKSEPTLTKDEVESKAKIKKSLLIDKSFSSWPGSQFICKETVGQTCRLVINQRHIFYSDLYKALEDLGDKKYIESLDLLLMSYARMEDELYDNTDDLDKIRSKWGEHLAGFLQRLKTEA